ERRRALVDSDTATQASELRRIRIDTQIGMAFSNLIAIAIIMTTAATLHPAGVTQIQSSAQAAAALKPLAGNLAELLFAIGLLGPGPPGVPVAGGPTGLGIPGGPKWPLRLAPPPNQAMAFQGGPAPTRKPRHGNKLTALDPNRALYWGAVRNCVLAAPVM